MVTEDRVITVRQPRDVPPLPERHLTEFWWFYGVALVALFVAAVVLPPVLHSGQMYWPLTLVGALVIGALLSAGAVPHLRQHR